MAIDSLNSVSLSNVAQASGTTGAGATRQLKRERDGDNDAGVERAGKGGMSKLLDAVGQALNSLGLSLPAPAAAGTTANITPSGDSQTNKIGGKSDVSQALHSFMHSLFQTLHSVGNGQGQTPASTQGQTSGSGAGTDADGDSDASSAKATTQGYGNDMLSKLQGLVQSLGPSTTSPPGASPTASATDSLSASFSHLVDVLGKNAPPASASPAPGTTAANAETNKPDLQAFLQKLVQNLQSSGGAVSTLGAAVNTLV